MRVLVMMSGGVDSSVAAGLLRDAGHEVVGATLKLWGGESDSGCCSVADVEDARRVAQVLGLDHHVFNYTDEFNEKVVAPYVAAHAAGRTPNPCVDCNRYIKFDAVFERAFRLGFDAVATGHHARVGERDGQPLIRRGIDPLKDQSYVLAFCSPSALERLVLPIGEMTKAEVRQVAETLGLRTFNKPDSQDVCFIESSRGRESFLKERMDLTPAEIVDADSGEVVGSVAGAELMTVGQRRGVSPGRDGQRRYVKSVDLVRRRVEIARLSDVVTTTLRLEPESLSFVASPGGDEVIVQVSAHGRPVAARLVRDDTSTHLELAETIRPVAPGQVVALYDVAHPELVIGAGIAAAP